MKFPMDYPYSPPSVRFLCKMWHPNVYEVCNFVIIHCEFSSLVVYWRIYIAVHDSLC